MNLNFIDTMQILAMGGGALVLISIPLYVVGMLMQRSNENKQKKEMMEMWFAAQIRGKETENMKNAGIDPAFMYANDFVATKTKSNQSIISFLLGFNTILFMVLIIVLVF